MTGGYKSTCFTCGKEFTLDYEERRWFRERGMKFPNRCRRCLAIRKANREREERAADNEGGNRNA